MKKQPDKGKITALYERLSHDDERAGESVSIENQKRILEDYAQKNGFTNIRHFTDDGVRGTTFKRPGLDAMLEEIRAGNVATVIIKDQSRIGRDVVEVGLLKRTFDEYHVRFIAANDNLDTANGFDIMSIFRDVINEWYVADTSRKIKTVFKSRMEKGLRCSGSVSYLALGGVGEKALMRFLSDRPNIKTVYLCLDSDQAGNDACSRLVELMPEGLTVHRLIPLFKDWNEVQTRRGEITDGKYLRKAVYGLKEPPQEETVEIIRMSEVDTQTVEWLWEPYIPFGKVTIVQGNPGEGKTTFALRLAVACSTGGTLPGMKPIQPFQVIYQTAEDGLGDTVKPRLIEAAADLDRVLVIDEAKRELTLSDERIEKAIIQNGARLIILDPIQAYMGDKADMNKANEVRPIFRRLAEVAERTGCAVILIGHLNKAAGGQSAYRGLGSIDFRAAARSVLLIGRVKREPNVRVIIHDKSSLAPEGKPVAFCLDPETGFSWIGEYDITADELLSGAGGNTATKTEQAEKLILDLLADGKELASEDIVKAAAEAGISERTVKNARRNLDTRIEVIRRGNQWYYRRNEAKSAK